MRHATSWYSSHPSRHRFGQRCANTSHFRSLSLDLECVSCAVQEMFWPVSVVGWTSTISLFTPRSIQPGFSFFILTIGGHNIRYSIIAISLHTVFVYDIRFWILYWITVCFSWILSQNVLLYKKLSIITFCTKKWLSFTFKKVINQFFFLWKVTNRYFFLLKSFK